MRSGWINAQFCVHKLIQSMIILLVVGPTLEGSPQPHFDISLGGLRGLRGAPQAPEEVTPVSRITVLVGQTALLPCVVRSLGDKVVSWIRNRDLHILTSGIFTFTSDVRFEVVHKPHIDYWGLKIKNTQLSDSGKYECQINTDPKMNFPVLLTIQESHMHMRDSPMDEAASETWSGSGFGSGSSVSSGSRAWATIQGPREQHVRVGSTITFTCVVSRAKTNTKANASRAHAHAHAHLKWTHAGRDVTFQTSRGGILVDTDYREESVTSRLTVAMVTLQDAGDYTCVDDGDVQLAPTSVALHVFEGERSEAMQSNSTTIFFFFAFYRRNPFLPLPLFLVLYFNWILR